MHRLSMTLLVSVLVLSSLNASLAMILTKLIFIILLFLVMFSLFLIVLFNNCNWWLWFGSDTSCILWYVSVVCSRNWFVSMIQHMPSRLDSDVFLLFIGISLCVVLTVYCLSIMLMSHLYCLLDLFMNWNVGKES